MGMVPYVMANTKGKVAVPVRVFNLDCLPVTIPAESVLGTLESVKVEGVFTQEQYPEDRDNRTNCRQCLIDQNED